MTLTHDEIAELQVSLQQLRKDLAPDDTRFYDRLFALRPEFRSLFRDDIAGQGMKFFSTLNMILEALTIPTAGQEETAELARFHGAIGVDAADYAPLGEALFETLQEVLGNAYTTTLDANWRKAYMLISNRMMAPDAPPTP